MEKLDYEFFSIFRSYVAKCCTFSMHFQFKIIKSKIMHLFTMKSFAGILILLTSVLVQPGCTKDNDDNGGGNNQCPDPVYPVEGLWVGTYTLDQEPTQPALFYSFVVYPGGDLMVAGKGADGVTYYSKGNWTLSGAIFNYTLQTFPPHNIQQEGNLTYSNNGTMTSGTWEDTFNAFGLNSGTFPVMNRVN